MNKVIAGPAINILQTFINARKGLYADGLIFLSLRDILK
jgi:hypothetical protein